MTDNANGERSEHEERADCESEDAEHDSPAPQLTVRMRWSDPVWIQSLLTAIAALVAFMTFVAICVQAFVYYGQLKEMEKSTDAATKAAKAAQDAVEWSRKTTRLDMRAWLSIDQVEGAPKPNEPFRIKIVIKNNGKTVARNVRFEPELAIVPIGEFHGVFASPATLIAPNAVKEFWVGATRAMVGKQAAEILSEEQLKELETGALYVVLHVRVVYLDVFDCEHVIAFAARMRTDGTYEVSDTGTDDNECS